MNEKKHITSSYKPFDNYYQLCQGKNQQIVAAPWLSSTSELFLLT